MKFFAVAAFLVSMASVAIAAPVAAPVALGISGKGTNDYGSDTKPSMVDTNTGKIVPFDSQKVDTAAQAEKL